MGMFIGSEKYARYGTGISQGGANTFILLLLGMSILCLILVDKNKLENPDIRQLYCMVPVFTFFGPLVNSNGSMIRISLYFYVYLTVIIPIILRHSLGNKYKDYLYIFILALIILMLKNESLDYHFFWESDPINLW